MTTYISSEAQNHGMNKQTNNVIEQIFRFHNKEREREREYVKTLRKSRNTRK